MEGNLRLKINWASLIVGSKFTVFALFYFVFEGNFPSTSPRGAYIWRGDLTEGFLHYEFGGLIFGGAYTWRGLFSEFYGMFVQIRDFVYLAVGPLGTSNKLTADLDVDALRNRLRIWVNAILQQLHSPSFDSDSHDSVFYRVENRLELY